MNTRIYLFVFAIIFSNPALSQDFSGEAVSHDKEEAKKLALADMQQNIYVKVETQSLVTQSNSGANTFQMTSKLSSSIPLLGVQTECKEQTQQHYCQVMLKANTSAPLYRAQIEHLRLSINEEWQKAKQETKTTSQHRRFTALLNLFSQLNRFIAVINLLEPSQAAQATEFTITEQDVYSELHKLEQTPKSITMLGLAIAQQFKQYNNVFIKPVSVPDSLEVTPFAAALQAEISKHANTVNSLQQAQFIFSGTYHFNKSHLQIAFSIENVNDSNKPMTSGTARIELAYLKEISYQPTHIDFDRLLKSEQLVDDTFIAKIQTNKGSRDLLFFENETIKILVKVNKPAYVYMVGHSRTPNKTISYLFDLKEAKGNAKFVNFLGNDEVNKWVVIGEFEVHPPFGTESLQLFASTKKPYNQLPDTVFDGYYYQIKGTDEQVVTKTRGLIRKSRAQHYQQPETSEAILAFTTRGK